MNRCLIHCRLLIGLLLAGTLLAACARQPPAIRDRRVVVLDFENSIQEASAAHYSESLAELMTATLVNYPRIAVIDRQNLSSLAARSEYQNANWRTLGKALGVDYVIAGSIARLEANYIISARLLSVTTGEIVKGSSVTRYCDREEDLYPVMQRICQMLAHHLKTLAEMHDQFVLDQRRAAGKE